MGRWLPKNTAHGAGPFSHRWVLLGGLLLVFRFAEPRRRHLVPYSTAFGPAAQSRRYRVVLRTSVLRARLRNALKFLRRRPMG